MAFRISALSKEYILVPVEKLDQDQSTDLGSLPVQMAFINGRSAPTPSDWFAADWVLQGDGTWAARCLVGPGAIPLVPGEYWVWVQITDTFERPVRRVGSFMVE